MIDTCFVVLMSLSCAQAERIEAPKAADPAIVVELVAAEPRIVTPVGLTVDDQGRVIVVESHTHFRPENYEGPPADRLRVFEDKDGDGTFETVATLHEGGAATMNVEVERDGSLLVANRSELYRLRRDAAGKVTGREVLARLETEGNYPHNGLSGLAVDLDGSIYVGMGENSGIVYTITGSDGTSLSGEGEGGNVFKLRSDGSRLRRFATGFWNPFELELDDYGRLFLVDNDPDSRPPCRLIFAVDGGDYGYRYRNGRRGTHPFTAWDGELPGTLPMASGTGEAPSGLLQYDSDLLPESVRGKLLVTSWGEHRIYQYPLEPRGAGVFSKRGGFVGGGVQFRPVGLAQAPDGSVFVSDWVDRDYNLHRKGRVWRIRSRDQGPRGGAADTLESADRRARHRAALALAKSPEGRVALTKLALNPNAAPDRRALAIRVLVASHIGFEPIAGLLNDPNPELRALAARVAPADDARLRGLAADDAFPEARADALRRLRDPEALQEFRSALQSDDPFARQAAMAGLGQFIAIETLAELTKESDARVRVGALVTLRHAGRPEGRRVLAHALVDSDPIVRQAAVQWVAESGLPEFKDRLIEGMRLTPVNPSLASSYVVALRRLEEGNETPDRELPYAPIAARIALDASLPVELRRLAMRGLNADTPALAGDGLTKLLESPEAALRAEAVRLLASRAATSDLDRLRVIAADARAPEAARAEAIAGLAATADSTSRTTLLEIAKTGPDRLRSQARRSLRGVALTPAEAAGLSPASEDTALIEGVLDSEAMKSLLARRGDAREGERVFFHPKGPGCFRCHQVEERGARIGPDLSDFGQNAGAARVLESILTPSQEIAPQFTAWQFVNKDGTIVSGQMIEDRGNEQVYADSEGKTGIIKLNQLEARTALPTSIMPENLGHRMTRQELRDLVEFLVEPRAPNRMAERLLNRP